MIVLYGFVVVGLKLFVNELEFRIFVGVVLKVFGVWFFGLLRIAVFEVIVFKLLFILILNDDDDNDIDGLNDDLNIEDEVEIVVFVWGGDWLILDYEIFEVIVLCGNVIISILEKLFDIVWFVGCF